MASILLGDKSETMGETCGFEGGTFEFSIFCMEESLLKRSFESKWEYRRWFKKGFPRTKEWILQVHLKSILRG